MNTTNKFTSTHARWISPTFWALVFYVLGASLMDSFAIYHTWRFVGEAEFVKMHIESGSRIVPFLVLPALMMTFFLVLQFWHRPKAVSRRLLWIAVPCVFIPWLSSAFIQIPMQVELDKGKNLDLLNALIVSDWIRVIPTLVLAFLVFTMVRKSIA